MHSKTGTSILHILNGDSSAYLFGRSGLEGQTAIWREMLVDGPCLDEVGSEDFWRVREEFFAQQLKVESGDYRSKVVAEWQKIEQWKQAKEVVLWFEFDLFCQINLLALCAYFAQFESAKVSLICVGHRPESDRKLGLGELSEKVYPKLFNNRQPLSREDLQRAAKVWKAYCHTNPQSLMEWAGKADPVFVYLKPAFQAHLKRFPNPTTGLNEIEMQLLKELEGEPVEPRKVIGNMLRWQDWYGFGDLQYEVYLSQLKGLYQVADGKLTLSQAGRSVLQGDIKHHPKESWVFGGVSRTGWNYESGRLIPS